MSFKEVILVATESSTPTESLWTDLATAYDHYKRNCNSYKTDAFDGSSEKKQVISEVLSPFYDQWKSYWEQFGFLNRTSMSGLLDLIEKHVRVERTCDYNQYENTTINDDDEAL